MKQYEKQKRIDNFVFPRITNQKMNEYLKVLGRDDYLYTEVVIVLFFKQEVGCQMPLVVSCGLVQMNQ